ncbi:enoyl-CoA hydratase-related protein [Hyphomonas sp.]|uniref:enoyl-CoA hydratase-related protein n=1 Tax=Hyphomonas sp. TaxID=87 RepID=UPI003F72AB4B
MTEPVPVLTQFRIEAGSSGLIHLIFDCPDRTMNVFSNKAIHELGEISSWLQDADVKGVVIRSGKASGFCAGADLTELGVAYEMIVATRPADRFDVAYNHFFPLSHAIRRLETAGKPIAAAIAGVALGGGCELALGAHYRVLADAPRAVLGLPECQVGLLPGAGGTQRMPRLVGVEAGLDVLLKGRTYCGEEALSAGLVGKIVPLGEEVHAAEAWLLSGDAHAVQPWDKPGVLPHRHEEIASTIATHRHRELARMLGHEPAPLAILDCVELGMLQPLDGAIRSEMSVFAKLIQRPEPRNMIRTLFLGKQAYEKATRAGAVPHKVEAAANQIATLVKDATQKCPALAKAGFGEHAQGPVQTRAADELWASVNPDTRACLAELGTRIVPLIADFAADEQLQLDHLIVRQGLVPAYLGGASGIVALNLTPM